MEKLNVLVMAERVSNVMLDTGEGAAACRERFPDLNWRFVPDGKETEADIQWANVITGHPRPMWLKNAENLRWLHIQSAGVNGYERREIYAEPMPIVTRAAGVHAPAMAEHALGLALSLTRRLPELYRNQIAQTWKPVHATKNLHGATVLMLGTGYLAADLVPLLKPFGCEIVGLRRDVSKGVPEGYDRIYPNAELHTALGEADYIFSTLPLTEATKGIMDAPAFDAVKPGAIFINMGRGKTVVTEALIAALESGKLGGAGIDVTDPEPLPDNHPLWRAPNLIITPHCSAWSDLTDKRRYGRFLELLGMFLNGKTLPGQIDFNAGY